MWLFFYSLPKSRIRRKTVSIFPTVRQHFAKFQQQQQQKHICIEREKINSATILMLMSLLWWIETQCKIPEKYGPNCKSQMKQFTAHDVTELMLPNDTMLQTTKRLNSLTSAGFLARPFPTKLVYIMIHSVGNSSRFSTRNWSSLKDFKLTTSLK